MNTKVELVIAGINELEKKIKKVEKILLELKDTVNEINQSEIIVTVKP